MMDVTFARQTQPSEDCSNENINLDTGVLLQAISKLRASTKKRPVRLPSTPCLPGRPKYEPGWLKIIATLAEANAIRPHSWASRLKVINQVGESVASVGSSEEDVLDVC